MSIPAQLFPPCSTKHIFCISSSVLALILSQPNFSIPPSSPSSSSPPPPLPSTHASHLPKLWRERGQSAPNLADPTCFTVQLPSLPSLFSFSPTNVSTGSSPIRNYPTSTATSPPFAISSLPPGSHRPLMPHTGSSMAATLKTRSLPPQVLQAT